jgi:hypothetical protein
MQGVDEQQHRRSQLTFLSTRQSDDTGSFHHLRRVRKAVSRSKSGVQGKIADVFSNRSRHAESQNELRGFRVLLAAGQPDRWLEQPFVLKYHHGGTRRRYTPDALVIWDQHREVVEIKEDHEADMLENQERFAVLCELLTEHGYCFRVWRSSEISKEPRLTNVASQNPAGEAAKTISRNLGRGLCHELSQESRIVSRNASENVTNCVENFMFPTPNGHSCVMNCVNLQLLFERNCGFICLLERAQDGCVMPCIHRIEITSVLKAEVTLSHSEDREFINSPCQFHRIERSTCFLNRRKR